MRVSILTLHLASDDLRRYGRSADGAPGPVTHHCTGFGYQAHACWPLPTGFVVLTACRQAGRDLAWSIHLLGWTKWTTAKSFASLNRR